MDNSDKIILDLCGGTGAWSKPYADAGYDVRNITLPEYDVRAYQPPNNVYGILAAPPCTEFSVARTSMKSPGNIRQGMEIVMACYRIIEDVICHQWERHSWSCFHFWALENPYSWAIRKLLGEPIFTFDPCEFGDLYIKRTALWGYFNLPKKKGRGLVLPNYVQNGMPKKARAITPPGFARAFFEANR